MIRLSAIGDCVHAVAMVQTIQRQWPQTRIVWIMGKLEAQLLGDLPGINVIHFDKKLGFAAIGKSGATCDISDLMPYCICKVHCVPVYCD